MAPRPPGFPAYPPYQYPPGFPPLPPPPPRGPRRAAAVVVTIIALILITTLTLGVTAAIAGQSNAVIGDGAVKSPDDNDGSDVRVNYLEQKAKAELADSAEGLLDGNEDKWLSVYDGSVHDEMKRRYNSLRALRVSSFDYQVVKPPEDKSGGTWALNLGVNYCLGGKKHAKCGPSGILFNTEWTDKDDSFLITRVDESDPNSAGPRPWEVEDLKAKVGKRAIVAGPAKYEDKLNDALSVAESAAENADKYAVYGKVDRYVIFLAGDEEFARWYGIGDPGDNVVGFAIPLPEVTKNGGTKPGGSEVVVHVDRAQANSTEFTATMRHELGHVATLHHSPEHHRIEEDWWLSEGVAELIDHGAPKDAPLKEHPYLRSRDVQEYFKKDKWNGKMDPATPTDDQLTGSAKYGIAFYGVYYLFDKYGKDKFMKYFKKIARNGEDPDKSTKSVYGKSYDALLKEIAKQVKKMAKAA
jgi:hypothetical protein